MRLNYIVELEEGVWIAPWNGDPGRTLKKEFADTFDTIRKARMALKKARDYKPFPYAQIYGVKAGWN